MKDCKVNPNSNSKEKNVDLSKMLRELNENNAQDISRNDSPLLVQESSANT